MTFFLLLMVGVATNYFIEPEVAENEGDSPRRNDPDIYMLNASITQYADTGAIRHRIDAHRFTHFPLTDITTLRGPELLLYNDNQDEPWDLSAAHGRMLPRVVFRDEIIELWDEVRVHQEDGEGNFIHITTESLSVYPDNDYAETDQKVIIDDNTGRTVAAGMKAYFTDGRFLFFSHEEQRVRTTLLPGFIRNE